MVKNLFLIRHAETAEANANQRDIERGLTPKGYIDASRVGRYLFEKQCHPDIILSSTAQRAMATTELLAEQLKFDANKIMYLEELYQASVRSLFNLLTEQKESHTQIVVVGHNPVLTYLAEYLTGEEIGSIVPCGVVKIQFDSHSWSTISKDLAKLVSYTMPEYMTI